MESAASASHGNDHKGEVGVPCTLRHPKGFVEAHANLGTPISLASLFPYDSPSQGPLGAIAMGVTSFPIHRVASTMPQHMHHGYGGHWGCHALPDGSFLPGRTPFQPSTTPDLGPQSWKNSPSHVTGDGFPGSPVG